MKIELSENGHFKEWKSIKQLEVNFAQMEGGVFENGYHFFLFDSESEIVSILEKHNNTPELEVYFYKNIVYISVESEPYLYYLEMFEEDLQSFRSQIIKDKKVLVASLKERKIENIFSYDVTG